LSYCSLTTCPQYWVTYAFLTVVESAINAVYWFPFYYVFKFVLVLWMALPQTGYGRSILYLLATHCTDNKN
jgi:receptor expression-enhancing protein 5/6